jgi:oligosaccharide repeat unit polymerase
MTLDLLSQAFLLLTLAALFAGTAVLLGDVLHPTPLLALHWLVVCGVYLLAPHHMRALSLETLVLVTMAVACFALGSGIPYLRRNQDRRSDEPVWESTVLRHLIFMLSLGGLPFFLLKAQELAASTAFTDYFFVNLRIALTGERSDAQTFGVLAYLLPVSTASALVEIVTSPRRRPSLRAWLAIALAGTYAVMATGRTFVFLLLIPIGFLLVLQHRARLGRILVGGVALAALAFIGVGSLANKIGVDIANADALAAQDAVMLYLLGSLAAFDVVLEQSAPLQLGVNVFRSVLAVLASLGLDVPVPSLVKPYVYVPEPTNVYTVFLPYYEDFGWLGVAVAFVLLGAMHAWLYRRATTTQNPRWKVLYALSMYALLMQFFQDQYVSLLTTWITFVLLVLPSFRRRPTAAGSTTP